MDSSKIGKFIKILRNERNLSQDKLAEMLNITRQAVSKWERGLSAPDPLTMKLLSELFEISVDEIIAGARKTKDNKEVFANTLLKMYEENYKKEKRIKRLIIILSSVIILFLGYYFVNTYNKIKVYLINGSSENFTMRHGIFLATNNKFYFRLGKFNNGDEKAISEFHLYYLNEEKERVTLFRSDDSNILLVDENGYDVYFEYEELPTIVENLYLDITYNGIIETMELNLEKDFANNYLTFFKEDKISEEEVENKVLTEEMENIEEIEKKILDNFKLNDDHYCYEINNNYFEYHPLIKVLKMKTGDGNIIYDYYVQNKMLTVTFMKTGERINACWNNDKNIKCEKEIARNNKEKIDYFFDEFEKLLLNFKEGN